MSNNNTLRVVLLCGLPGSGKSSLSRSIQEKWNLPNSACSIIEYDELQHDATSVQAWHDARCNALSQLKRYLSQASSSEQQQQLILLDDNFHLKSMRKQIYLTLWQQRQTRNASFGIIYMDTPLNICIERNNDRTERKVPEAVILRMHETLDRPSATNYWEQSVLTIVPTSQLDTTSTAPNTDLSNNNSNTTIIDDAILHEFLANGLLQVTAPPPQVSKQQTPDARTTRQMADLFWRRAVKVVATMTSSKAQTANQARQACLRSWNKNSDSVSMEETNEQEWLELFLTGQWLTREEEEELRNQLIV